MSNRFVGEDDGVVSTAKVPVCLVLDLSSSMLRIIDTTGMRETGRTEFRDGKTWNIVEGGKTSLDNLNEGLVEFYEAINDDEVARLSCELAIVGFSDNAQMLQDFGLIDGKKAYQISDDLVGDNTNMEAGVNLGLDLLEKRKNLYKSQGVDYYQPWIVIMTDGEATSDVSRSQSRCKDLEAQKKLVVFPISVYQGEGKEDLSGFSNKRKPMTVKTGKLKSLFEWLGKSISTVSKSQVGDKVVLEKPEDDFFEL